MNSILIALGAILSAALSWFVTLHDLDSRPPEADSAAERGGIGINDVGTLINAVSVGIAVWIAYWLIGHFTKRPAWWPAVLIFAAAGAAGAIWPLLMGG